MTVEIRVAGIELLARHGVEREERAALQRFRFDVALALAGDAAVESDRLEDTIDYRAVVACVSEVATAREYALLETLAGAVGDALRQRFAVREVAVTVAKPDVDLAHGARPSVTVRRP